MLEMSFFISEIWASMNIAHFLNDYREAIMNNNTVFVRFLNCFFNYMFLTRGWTITAKIR